jgi:hypothetical protein
MCNLTYMRFNLKAGNIGTAESERSGFSCDRMRLKFFILIVSIWVVSCRDRGNTVSAPPATDINDIVRTIVLSGPLPVTKSAQIPRDTGEFDIPYYPYPLCIDLDKIRIKVSRDTDYPYYFISDILDFRVNGEKFFNSSDSAYIVFQANEWTHFRLDTNLAKGIIYANIETLDQIIKGKGDPKFFRFSIPIMSADHKRAYIILTKFFNRLGKEHGYFLEKIQGKWTIVYSTQISGLV